MHRTDQLDSLTIRTPRTDQEKIECMLDARDKDLASMPRRTREVGLTKELARQFPWQYTAKELIELKRRRVTPEIACRGMLSLTDWSRMFSHDRTFEHLDEYLASGWAAHGHVDAFYAALAVPGSERLPVRHIAEHKHVALIGLAGRLSVDAVCELLNAGVDVSWLISDVADQATADEIAKAWETYLLSFAECQSCHGPLGSQELHACPYDAELGNGTIRCNCCESCTSGCHHDT